nr:zinc finger, CCHC-type [Tanacetum cinerariifolium]
DEDTVAFMRLLHASWRGGTTTCLQPWQVRYVVIPARTRKSEPNSFKLERPNGDKDSSNGDTQDSFDIELNFPVVLVSCYNDIKASTISELLNGVSVVDVVLPLAKDIVEFKPQLNKIEPFVYPKGKGHCLQSVNRSREGGVRLSYQMGGHLLMKLWRDIKHNIHISNDIESNDYDDEDISSNGNMDLIEALDDFIQHVCYTRNPKRYSEARLASLDPLLGYVMLVSENKPYLSHSFIEQKRVVRLYDGQLRVDIMLKLPKDYRIPWRPNIWLKMPQDSDKLKGNNIAGPSVVSMVEHNNSSRGLLCARDDVVWWVNFGETMHVCKNRCWFKTYESLNDGSILHMENESTTLVHGRDCVDLRFRSGKVVSLLNVLHVPNIKKNLVSSSVLNNYGYKQVTESNKFVLSKHGIECIFLRYAEHSKAFRFFVIKPNDSILINPIIESRDATFDENRFSSVPIPSQRSLVNETKYIGGLVVPEKVTDKKEAINDEMDFIMGNNTWVLADLPPGCKPFGCKWIFKIILKVDRTIKKFKARLVIQGFKQKSGIDYFDKYALVARISIIRLASIHNLIIHQMDVKTAFLNGDLDEEAPKQWIKYESIGIEISQSHYIENVLKKFNYFDCTLVSTPMDTSKKLMPNNGQAVSQLEYSRVIGCLMYAMTCIRPGIAFAVGELSMYTSNPAAGKEAEWLKNLLLKIPLWSKPIVPIFFRCDSAAILAKPYSQMYNGKSRHLGVRHSMIHELIMNRVISIEFLRSQKNLVDHLTKGLARDLVIKSAEGIELKHMYLHIILRMCLEPAEKEDEVFTSQWRFNVVEEKEVEKIPPNDLNAADSKPPGFEKGHIYNNDDVTSRVGNEDVSFSTDHVKVNHTVTHKDMVNDEVVSDNSKPPAFENFIKENKACSRSSITSRACKYFEDMVKEKWVAIFDLEQSKPLHTKIKDLESHLKLCIADRDFLESMVSMDEIKAAVWDCGSQKSLRPDGYYFMFIKKIRDLLKHNIQPFVRFEARGSSLIFSIHYCCEKGLHMALNDHLAANMFHGVKDSKKLAWVKWSNILAFLDKGGLGVSSLKAFNMSLLLKWRWRLFHNSNALWVYVVKTIHGDESNCFIQQRIANGSWFWDWSRQVNVRRTKAEFDTLIFDIANLEPEELVDSDTCIWSLSNDDKFLVNLVRKHIDELYLPSLSPCTRWCKIIPRKVNILMWRMFLDRLSNRLNLSFRGLDIDSILCPVCNIYVESSTHTFFSCDIAAAVCHLVRVWSVCSGLFLRFNQLQTIKLNIPSSKEDEGSSPPVNHLVTSLGTLCKACIPEIMTPKETKRRRRRQIQSQIPKTWFPQGLCDCS